MPGEVRLAPPSRSVYYVWSGSRQSDRLPPEMTPVTERSAANLQASFCLNSPSPCCQILIFSVTASIPPLCFNLSLQSLPAPAFSNTQTTTRVTKIALHTPRHTHPHTHKQNMCRRTFKTHVLICTYEIYIFTYCHYQDRFHIAFDVFLADVWYVYDQATAMVSPSQ